MELLSFLAFMVGAETTTETGEAAPRQPRMSFDHFCAALCFIADRKFGAHMGMRRCCSTLTSRSFAALSHEEFSCDRLWSVKIGAHGLALMIEGNLLPRVPPDTLSSSSQGFIVDSEIAAVLELYRKSLQLVRVVHTHISPEHLL